MRFLRTNNKNKSANHSTAENNTVYTKLFAKKDILVYVFLILFVLILFCTFVIPSMLSKAQSSNGFKVTIDDKTVLTHNYGTNEWNIVETWKNRIEIIEDEGNYLIKISFNNSFNLIFCNEKEHYVKMKDSTCSHSADCKYLPAIYNSGIIFCAPHNLKVSNLSSNGQPPITG